MQLVIILGCEEHAIIILRKLKFVRETGAVPEIILYLNPSDLEDDSRLQTSSHLLAFLKSDHIFRKKWFLLLHHWAERMRITLPKKDLR